MSEYKGIQGFSIEIRAGNPSPLIVGQIFYDTTTGTLKIVVNVAGTPTVRTITTS
jgi:hypothetical protein